MYARVVNVDVKPNSADEVLSIYENSVIPAAKQQQGFVEAKLMINEETNKGISITIWESEETMLAGQQSEYLNEQIAKFGDYFTAPPTTDNYEITYPH
ncbi:MAG: antibiotic biosynthesis monooxygenase family protein [Candidatus Kariarchaeaceae archaeon]|jgi:heme-degrading monooxygenase HmoA